MAFKLKNSSPFSLINEGPGDDTKKQSSPKANSESINKINEWNKSRLATGRFNDQLGGGKLKKQSDNMTSTKIVSKSDFSKMGYDVENSSGAYGPEDHVMFSEPSLTERIINKFTGRSGTKLHETAHSARAIPQINKIKEVIKTKTPDPYYNDPEETYSKLMELRIDNNVDPNKVWGKKDLPELRGMSKRFDKPFLGYYSDSELLDLMNKVAISDKKTNNKNIV